MGMYRVDSLLQKNRLCTFFMQVLMIVHHKWFRLLHGCQFAGCVDLIHALHFPSIVNDPKRTALFDDETVVVLRDGMLHRFCEFRKGRQNCSVLLDDICAFVIVGNESAISAAMHLDRAIRFQREGEIQITILIFYGCCQFPGKALCRCVVNIIGRNLKEMHSQGVIE